MITFRSDETWGSKVAALIVLRDEEEQLDIQELKEWGSSKMPSYSFPTVIKFTKVLPKNAMGKVNKRDLIRDVFTPKPTAEETPKN